MPVIPCSLNVFLQPSVSDGLTGLLVAREFDRPVAVFEEPVVLCPNNGPSVAEVEELAALGPDDGPPVAELDELAALGPDDDLESWLEEDAKLVAPGGGPSVAEVEELVALDPDGGLSVAEVEEAVELIVLGDVANTPEVLSEELAVWKDCPPEE